MVGAAACVRTWPQPGRAGLKAGVTLAECPARPGRIKTCKTNPSQAGVEGTQSWCPAREPPALTEHLLGAARAEGRGGKCRRGRQHCGPCLPTRARSLILASSLLLAGDQLYLRPTSELSVFFGGACDPGQPGPVFEPCPARCGTENTRVFVSKILLKITPSLES